MMSAALNAECQLSPPQRGQAAELSRWLREARAAAAFTGAGISTESGIPDFRSPGGIWSQAAPVYFEDFLRSAEARFEHWRQKSISHLDFAGAKPNRGHEILAAWEQAGRIRGVITQNIDGLHQQAGSRCVLELHGTAREVSCLGCGARFPADSWLSGFQQSQTVPDCPACGGLLKVATVSFGQTLPADVLQAASEWAAESDVFLALGSSLAVHPAAGIPLLARSSGAKLCIINRDPTPLDGDADLVIRAPLGATLAEICRLLDETGGS